MESEKIYQTRSVQGNATAEGVLELLIADPANKREYVAVMKLDPKNKNRATLTLSLSNHANRILERSIGRSESSVNIKWRPNMTAEEEKALSEKAKAELRAKQKPRDITVYYPIEMALRKIE